MGCGINMVKYMLFLFNLIFSLAGLAILVLGVLFITQIGSYSDFLESKFNGPPIVLIVVGSIIFVVAFYGCCGAIRESHCMVVTFAVFLLTIFIIQVVIAGVAFVYSDDTQDVLDTKMKETVQNYYVSKDAQALMDLLQTELQCCGADGPQDYLFHGSSLPTTCCLNNLSCKLIGDGVVHFTIGCKKALDNYIYKAGVVLGGVAIGVAVVELVGVIFALCLANSIKNRERRGR